MPVDEDNVELKSVKKNGVSHYSYEPESDDEMYLSLKGIWSRRSTSTFIKRYRYSELENKSVICLNV